MRVTIIIIAWLLLGVFYWWQSGRICDIEKVDDKSAVTYFHKNATDFTSDRMWITQRDSIITIANPDDTIVVLGYAYQDEDPNVAQSRADRYADKFKDFIATANIRTETSILDEDYPPSGSKQLVQLYIKSTSEESKAIENHLPQSISNEAGSVEGETNTNNNNSDGLICFEISSVVMSHGNKAIPQLDRLASDLIKDTRMVRLIGHTDSSGGKYNNIELGYQRALAVEDYLIKRGIIPNRIMAETVGARFPFDSNDTEAGRARNRCVEVKICQ